MLKGLSSGMPLSAKANNQVISTCTRRCMKPCSLMSGRRLASLAA